MKLTSATLLAAAGAVQAVDFSSWNGLACRGAQVTQHKGTTPYRCYYIGSAASIKAFGLGGHPPAKYVMYSDTRCSKSVGYVKYNNLCEDWNFLSIALFTPLSENESDADMEKRSVELPPEGSEDWVIRQLRLARDGHPMDNSTEPMTVRALGPSEPSDVDAPAVNSAKFRREASTETSALETTSAPPPLHRRNTGDRYHTSEYNITALDQADSTDPPSTGFFIFRNDHDELAWGGRLLDRLWRRPSPHTFYENNQRLYDRELECDLYADSGNIDSIDHQVITRCLNLFLLHRTHDGNQRWQFYRNGNPLFYLTFRARTQR